ncbi:hypothetical protein [Ferrimonas sp.]|uniref:hypothetical protein n=1 Tax=Ferrimonas sp. TaxID=2080861 RepID=UPI003A8F1CE5
MSQQIILRIRHQGGKTQLEVSAPALPATATPEQALEYLLSYQLAHMLPSALAPLLRSATKLAQDKLPKVLDLATELHQQGVCDDHNATQH